MIKFTLSPALLSATGWFIGLLFVMIIVTALFAMVLVIALKPIKKFETDENDMSKKLERRETELTIKLLKNSNDPSSIHHAWQLGEILVSADFSSCIPNPK